MQKFNIQPEQRFQEQYALLNLEQRQAVDTIYGPVLVIAGPGTGKTQILSLRIANLLLSDAQVQAYNILCLTFTDEGKKNMRDRLYKLLGPETAQHVSVHTFHSFCNEVIQQNLNYFNKDILDPVSELEEIQIIKEILSELPSKHPLYNAKNPLAGASFIKQLFAKMKQENWSVEYLSAKAIENIEEIKQDPKSISSRGPTKGNLKGDAIKKIESLEKLLNGIPLFTSYQEKMLERHRYDYNDMIQWVITMFKERPDTLLFYQEKYQFLLVDEFQDTNGSQLELVNLLSSFDSSPNTFVVGDDDQSIFRFQGASVENMNLFKEKYKEHGLTEICLKTNYRSYQGILDVAQNLISLNTTRLVNTNPLLDKNLRSSSTETSGNDFNPELFSFHSARYENVYIAMRIKQLIDEGVKPSEIAVLYYDNKSCLELGKYLQILDISYYSKKQENLLDEVFAKQILNIFRYIALELAHPYSGDELLFYILHYHFFAVSPIEIAKASIAANQYSYENRKTKNSFRRYLQEQLLSGTPSLFNETASEALQHAARSIESLIKDAENKSLIQMMDAIMEHCALVKYIHNAPNKFELLEVLRALFDTIKEEAHRNPDLSITDFIALIELMEDNNIAIAKTKLYGNEDSVRLFTVHASKGREFEYVFVAGCTADAWESRRGGNRAFAIPDGVYQTAISDKEDEELRRMMYVALTRAKKELYVSYHQRDSKDKEMEKSKFLYEIFGHAHIEKKPSISQEDFFYFESLHKEAESKVAIETLEKEYVQNILNSFEMNVTALNAYLNCPLKFYYNSIVRIPSGVSEPMTFGSAIHHALEYFFLDMKKNNQEFPALPALLDHFEYYMRRNREKFSKDGYPRFIQYGNEILTAQYENKIELWNKQVELEKNVTAVVNGIPIKGLMDKIESTDAGDIVVDYKTGDISSSSTKSKFKLPDEEQEGGDYWRQAAFYKLLLDNQHPRRFKTIGVKYEFIEPDKKSKQIPEPIYLDIGTKDLVTVQHQITTVWEKIQNHEFYVGCGDEKCTYCKFAKDTNQVLPSEED